MKHALFASIVSTVALSAASFGAPKDAAQLQIYPKNLARQHLGANLFHYSGATQSYSPTEAAAAWLDDDITTGWPLLAGKQYYLLVLPESELITNFCLSARPATGTVSLYTGSEPATPDAKSWSPLSKNIAFESINEKKLAHAFSREAKYVLIETDVADPGPIYSLYLYGEQPAVSYSIIKRDQQIDTHAIFGPYVNEQTSFNVAGLYAKSYVAEADTAGSLVSWQKAIDDNPESALAIAPSGDKSGVVIRFDGVQSVARVAMLANSEAKGKLDFYLVNRDVAANENVSQLIKASTAGTPAADGTAAAPSAAPADASPTVSLVLDGTNARSSLDFPAVQANEMVVRWTPAAGTDSIKVHELNVFGAITLASYAAVTKLDAVASKEGGADPSKDSSKDSSKDGKTIADAKDGKNMAPIAAGPTAGPFLPGSLGFPPTPLSPRPHPVFGPKTPVSQ